MLLNEYGSGDGTKALAIDNGGANLIADLANQPLVTGPTYFFGASVHIKKPLTAAPTGIGILEIKNGLDGATLATMLITSGHVSDHVMPKKAILATAGIYFDWSRVGSGSPTIEGVGVLYYGPKHPGSVLTRVAATGITGAVPAVQAP